MRAIKFRGKNKDGHWVYGDLVGGCLIRNSVDISLGFDQRDFHKVYPATVGQFTGLTDINGKDVYEGDKVRIPATSQYEEATFNSFSVFYHGNDCTPTDCGLVLGRMETHGHSAGGFGGYKLIPRDVSRMEIIGNIHEVTA